MMLRALVATIALVFGATAANAAERITDFDVTVDVEDDGDIRVTEMIQVNAEGNIIRRGIFRDLPRRYEKNGRALPYAYDVKTVMRDGRTEPYAIEKDGNAFRIRIGDGDVFLESGRHSYKIVYEVKNQVRYFDNFDEVYWNATGNYWNFPIDTARARVLLPGAADATQIAAYTGREGEAGADYAYQFADGAHVFTARSALQSGEGMTIAVGFAKGVVDAPSAADARAEWWMVNLSIVILGGAAALAGAFYAFMWNRVGRDPAKGPVFPRYEPPKGYSPAAVHHVFHRGLSGHSALIATLVNLAVRRRIKIDVDRKKKETVLTPIAVGASEGLSPIDVDLERSLLPGNQPFSFGSKYSATLTSAYEAFKTALHKAYGAPYFKLNYGYLAIAIAFSIVATILAAKFTVQWTSVHTAAVASLVIMALAGARFLPAPTPKGQEIRTQIEGFRLYLKTAEQLQLNAVKVGSEGPPPMTVERYERFVPYAIALGVEKPWTEHFEKLMPREAVDYQPYWASGNFGDSRSLSGLNSALVSSMASGVSSSMPQSSSSSGSGGGGSSGGGGGGGGGGGW